MRQLILMLLCFAMSPAVAKQCWIFKSSQAGSPLSEIQVRMEAQVARVRAWDSDGEAIGGPGWGQVPCERVGTQRWLCERMDAGGAFELQLDGDVPLLVVPEYFSLGIPGDDLEIRSNDSKPWSFSGRRCVPRDLNKR